MQSIYFEKKILLNYLRKYDPNINNDHEMDDNSKNDKERINVKDKLLFLLKNFFKENKKVFVRDIIKDLPIDENNGIDEKFWKTIITYAIVEGFLEKDIVDFTSIKISNAGNKFISSPKEFYVSKDNDFSKSKKIENQSIKSISNW